jgi:hypothetical protein
LSCWISHPNLRLSLRDAKPVNESMDGALILVELRDVGGMHLKGRWGKFLGSIKLRER